MNIIAGVLIKKENKYLLVQEKKPEVCGLWNWPAGHVEESLSVVQTAVKEAKEETGYQVKIIKEIKISKDSEDNIKRLFVAKIIGGQPRFPKDEILNIRWFTKEKILEMRDKLRNPWVIEGINNLEKSNEE